MTLAVLIITTVLIFLFTKLWSHCTFNYWEKRNVKGPKPLPIIGNILPLLLGKKNIGQLYADCYSNLNFKQLPWIGIYNMRTPQLLLKDANLIRDVLIKDFKSFENNGAEVNSKIDPLFSKNVFFLKGEEWKWTRTDLIPSLTLAKIKTTMPNINRIAEKMIEYVKNNSERALELKELSVRFMTDNVFSIIYSMDGKSFEEESSVYFQAIRETFSPSLSHAIRATAVEVMPWFLDLMSLTFLPKKLNDILLNLPADVLKFRRENAIRNDDLLTFMSELKQKTTGKNFSDVELANHAATLVLDSVESSASAMAFVLYELAANPEIQEKLFEEINSVVVGEVTFDTLQEMKYLDWVCSEALRLHPPVSFMIKVCTESHRLKYSNKEEITIEKGTSVVIPILGIHMDAKYFPKPEVFDPDRFSIENRSNIVRGSYLPFGDGPRMCIGQKFGLVQMKMGVVELVRNFRIEVHEKTKVPLKIDPFSFVLNVEGGLWAVLKIRHEK